MSLVTKGLKVLGRSGEKKAARKGAEELAVRKVPVKPKAPVKSDLTVPRKAPAAKPKPKPKALPAPEKRLALPAPGPGLPDYAAKPRGGNWWPNIDVKFPGWSGNYSPERAAQISAERFLDDDVLRAWWERAVPRYIKNDMATPEDPLRDLAVRGLLHRDMDPDQWSAAARGFVNPDSVQEIMFGKNPKGGMPGAGSNFRGSILSQMPWVGKLPAHEKLYGVPANPVRVMDEQLGFRHVADELSNALRAEEVGLPADLAVRPESLARMSFPQAVERVGRINQWRAKEADRAALSALDSPAIQVFKEYPENNPGGLRWVELRAPEAPADRVLPEGWQINPRLGGDRGRAYELRDPEGVFIADFPDEVEAVDAAYRRRARDALQQALKYEGDVMGHCVGGYCDDVLSGRSRIFSLRDARGEPRVTIETAPPRGRMLRDVERDAEAMRPGVWAEMRAATASGGNGYDWLRENYPDVYERAYANPPEDIVQITGKQNLAPKEDYLPYVQDFVKSGTWGQIGGLKNAGLVRLPDQRLIGTDQMQDTLRKIVSERFPEYSPERDRLINRGFEGAIPEDMWPDLAPYFEGFAVGGRVRANPYRIER